MATDEGAGAGSILLAFLLGAVSGAAVALLYAPYPGKKMQKKVFDVVEDGVENIQGFAKKISKG